MRALFRRSIATAAVVTGLLTLTAAADTAHAQGKPPAAQPKAGTGEKPKKPLTEAQKKDAAKKAFEDGGKKFDAGDFTGAYAAFKEADDMVPGAVPKYRMAESLDKASATTGDVAGAIKAYEDFLATNPPADKQQARIDNAKARIDALKKTPADVKVNVTPATAALAVDGVAQTGNPLKVAPGKHTISATADGFDEGKTDVEVAFAEKKEVTLTLNAKAAEPIAPVAPPPAKPEKPLPPPEKPSGGNSKVPAIITLSLAGAGVVVGTVFGVLALKSKSDFKKTPTQDLYDKTERNALIADMSYGVAITFGVTGIVLLVSGGKDEPAPAKDEKKASIDKPKFDFAPWAGPTGGGAMGQITF